jgi:heptosyltransferase-2
MDRLVFWIYRIFGAILRALPLKLVFLVGQVLGSFGFYVAGPYRQVALRNLEIAFGTELSRPERHRLARKHFSNLIANLLTSVTISGMSREAVEALADVENLETQHRIHAAGQGTVMAINHMGNWELLSQISPFVLKGPLGTVYQRLGNRFIDAEMRESRGRLGVQLFERKEGFAGALKALRAAGVVGVLIDQHAGDAGVWCPFFGRLASTSSLAATLALRSGAALIPAALYTIAPGRWRFVIGDPLTSNGRDVEGLTAELNIALEKQIRLQPEDWFWVHNRWKTPQPKFLLATYKRGVAETVAGRGSLKRFRILIRSSNWLGDAVMSVPAVRAIRRGRPDAHVTILTPEKLADFWREVPEVDEILPIEQGDSVFAVARKVRDGGFDAAVLFPNSARVALEVWVGGVPRRVGYPGHRRAWLLNQVLREKRTKKKQPRPPEHQVHHYLRLAEFIGADVDSEKAALDNRRSGTRSIANLKGRVVRIGVCPGAEYGPAKRWLPERFAEVITAWNARHSAEWVLFGVTKDAPIGEEIQELVAGACRNLIGRTSLRELIEELRACDVLLTNDTGTMHLAAHLGIPTVAVFGSTEPELTGPLGSNHRVLRHHVECSPCFLRECPLDFRCMLAIESREVLNALESLLSPPSNGTNHLTVSATPRVPSP